MSDYSDYMALRRKKDEGKTSSIPSAANTTSAYSQYQAAKENRVSNGVTPVESYQAYNAGQRSAISNYIQTASEQKKQSQAYQDANSMINGTSSLKQKYDEASNAVRQLQSMVDERGNITKNALSGNLEAAKRELNAVAPRYEAANEIVSQYNYDKNVQQYGDKSDYNIIQRALKTTGNVISSAAKGSGAGFVNAAGNIVENIETPNERRDINRDLALYNAAQNSAEKEIYAEKLRQNEIRKTKYDYEKDRSINLPTFPNGERIKDRLYNIADQLQTGSAEDVEKAKWFNPVGGKFGEGLVDAATSGLQSTADFLGTAALGLSGAGAAAYLPFALRSYGSSTQKARQFMEQNGTANDPEALRKQNAYGVMESAKEVGTEMLFGLIGAQARFTKGSSLDDFAREKIIKGINELTASKKGGAILAKIGELAVGGASEGLEEVIGDVFENFTALDEIYGGEAEKVSAGDMLYDFLVGSMSGLMGEAAMAPASKIYSNYKAGKDVLENRTYEAYTNENGEEALREVPVLKKIAENLFQTGTKAQKESASAILTKLEAGEDVSVQEAGALAIESQKNADEMNEAIDYAEAAAERLNSGEQITPGQMNVLAKNNFGTEAASGIKEFRDRGIDNVGVDATTEERRAALSNINMLESMSKTLGTNGENAMKRLYDARSDASVESYVANFTRLYNEGKNGLDTIDGVDIGTLTEPQAYAALDAGRFDNADASNKAFANADKAPENVEQANISTEMKSPVEAKIEGDNANEERADAVSGRPRWSDSESASFEGRSVSEIAEAKRDADPKGFRGYAADRGSLKTKVGKLRTAVDFGITGGTEASKVFSVDYDAKNYLSDSNLSASVKRAITTAKSAGIEPVLFAGGNISTTDGEARGVYDPATGKIYIRIDDRDATANQIAKHEATHKLLNDSDSKPAVLRAAKDKIDKLLRDADHEGDYEFLAMRYANLYGFLVEDDGVKVIDESRINDILEEIICDAEAGINLFGKVNATSLRQDSGVYDAVRRGFYGFKNDLKAEIAEADRITGVEAKKSLTPQEKDTEQFVVSYIAPAKLSIVIANDIEKTTREKAEAQQKAGKLTFDLALLDATQKQLNERILPVMKGMMGRYDKNGLPLIPETPNTKLTNNVFSNSSYMKDAEPTTECYRQRIYREMYRMVTDELGRPLTNKEALIVNQAAIEIGVDAPCIYCYSLLDRKAKEAYKLQYIDERDAFFDSFAKEFGGDLEQFKKNKGDLLSKYYDAYVNRTLDPSNQDGKKNRGKMNKDKEARVRLWMDLYAEFGKDGAINLNDIRNMEAEDVLKAEIGKKYSGIRQDLKTKELKDIQYWIQSSSQAKKYIPYTAYTNQKQDSILNWKKPTIDALNAEYGLRWYSHADFHPAFIMDNIQQITDAAVMGLKGLMYVKPIEAAKIFAPTGMNINLSCFAQQINGEFVADNRLGADWDEVKKLRSKNRNVGSVMVCTNDEQCIWAMTQDWIDVVIPLHLVRGGNDFVSEFKLHNYSQEQADKVIKDAYDKYIAEISKQSGITDQKKIDKLKKQKKFVYPTEHENSYEKYASICEERGLTPRFDRFRQLALEGETSYDGVTLTPQMYMKLVNETRRPYNQTEPLIPKFDLKAAEEALDTLEAKGYYKYFFDSVELNGRIMTPLDMAHQAAQDILAGKKANELGYGRTDIPVDENGELITVSSSKEAKKLGLHGIHRSLAPVDPIVPSSSAWTPSMTTEEVKNVFPGLWDVSAESSETRNPTQIAGTVSTYRKIYDKLKAEGFDGDILDASSGLGIGTETGRSEYGYDVDDVEPFPGERYSPRYTDYSVIDKQYDVIISNAVLNVLPRDQRDALVVKMGEMLRPGGRLFVNVRSTSEIKNLQKNPKNITLSDSEAAETTRGSYQKGFSNSELKAYLEDALGSDFTVSRAGAIGTTAMLVTRNDDSGLKFSINVDGDTVTNGAFINDGENYKNADLSYTENIKKGLKKGETREQRINGSVLEKAYESGERIALVQTGVKGEFIAYATTKIGKPEWISAEKWEDRRIDHRVPEGSRYDLKEGMDGKWYYPFVDLKVLDTPVKPVSKSARGAKLSKNTDGQIEFDEVIIRRNQDFMKNNAEVLKLFDDDNFKKYHGDYPVESQYKAESVIKDNPEFDFIERRYRGDKNVEDDLERFVLNSGLDLNQLEAFGRMSSSALNDLDSIVKIDSVSWFWDAFNNLEAELIRRENKDRNSERIQFEVREYDVDEIYDIFKSLNKDNDLAKIAERVFPITKDLGIKYYVSSRYRSAYTYGGHAWIKKIRFNEKAINDPESSNEYVSRLLLHEAIHAATVEAIDRGLEAKGKSNVIHPYTKNCVLLVEELEDILAELRKDKSLGKHYGFKNIKEMIAEMSNVNFRETLKRKSLFSRIVDSVAKLFGIKREDTAFDRLNKLLDYSLEIYKDPTFRIELDRKHNYAENYNDKYRNWRSVSADYAPTFYSKLQSEVTKYKGDKIGSASIIPYLKGKGVKDEEIKWSGINQYLEGKKSVSKDDLLEFLKDNELDIELAELSKNIDTDPENWPKWRRYSLEGGDEYREILFIMEGESEYKNLAMSAHWGRGNVLASARVQDFSSSRGTNSGDVLFAEEIQSDWHNDGEKNGYSDDGDTAQKTDRLTSELDELYKWLEDAKPRENEIAAQIDEATGLLYPSWVLYGAMINDDDGYEIKHDIGDFIRSKATPEQLGFYKEFGEKQKRIQEVRRERRQLLYTAPDAPFKNGKYVDFVLKRLIREAAEKNYQYLAWTTGKMQEERWSNQYAEGYRIEYDQDIPKFLKKYVKQWGSSVEMITMYGSGGQDYVVPAIQITEPMREDALYVGQPRFSRAAEDNAEIAKLRESVRQKRETIRNLKADLAKAEARIEDLKFGIQFGRAREDDVKKFTESLLKGFASTLKVKEIYPDLKKFYEMAMFKDVPKESSQLAREIAEKIVMNASELKEDATSGGYESVKKTLKNTPFYITREQAAEIPDFEKWRRSHMSTIRVRYADSIHGPDAEYGYNSIRDALGAGAESFGLPAFGEEGAKTAGEALMNIAEFLDAYAPVYENPHTYQLADAIEGCYQMIWDALFDEQIRRVDSTYADALEKKIDDLEKKLEKARKERIVVEDGDARREAEDRYIELERAKKEIEELNHRIGIVREGMKDEGWEMAMRWYNDAVSAERKARDKMVFEVQKHFSDIKERERARHYDSLARQRLMKIAARLKNKKLPAVSRQWVEEKIGDLDTVAMNIMGVSLYGREYLAEGGIDMDKGGGKTNLLVLQNYYDKLRAEQGENFQPDARIEAEIRRLRQRSVKDLSLNEVMELTDVLLAFENEQRIRNKLVKSKVASDVFTAGMKVIDDINKTRGTKGGLIDKIATATSSPLREIARITGHRDSDPLYIAANELNEGQRKMNSYNQMANKMFEKWLTNKAFMKGFSGKDAAVYEIEGENIRNGKKETAKITHAMVASLYLHAKNEQNMYHIMRGGVKIPDYDLYKKGDLEKAYDSGKFFRFQKKDLIPLFQKLTDAEKGFCDKAFFYFNKASNTAINEVSEELKGYSLAEVENYFPIDTDGNFVSKEFDTIKQDGSIEGMGFTKERIKGAANPIMLYDLNTIVTRSVQQHSKYVGLAIPVRNFNLLYNAKTFKGGNLSLASTIAETWGSRANRYIADLMADLQSPKYNQDDLGRWLDKLRSRYAGAVLSINAATAIKQASSYPTAAAILSTKSLMNGLKLWEKVDENIINRYTPTFWMRTIGLSTKELGDIGKEGKELPKWLNWIQQMDVATTKRLWAASEYEIKDTRKDLTPGTDDYYFAVAELYNRVIEETQPNYSTMQRPAILRSKNALTNALMMFKTQPFQNFNILSDAIGTYQARLDDAKSDSSESAKEALVKARKNLGKAIASQAVAAFTFALMQMAWDWYRDKDDDYTDEDGEYTFLSWIKGMGIKTAAGVSGMVPFGSELLTSVESAADSISKALGGDEIFGTTDYGFSISAIESINDAVSAVKSAATNIAKLGNAVNTGGKPTDIESYTRGLVSNMVTIAQYAGVPASNVKKLFDSTATRALKAFGKYDGAWEALRITTDPVKYSGDYYDLLYNAYTESPDDFKALYEKATKLFDADKIKSAMEKRMKVSAGVSSVTELPERFMAAPVDESEYADQYMKTSSVWESASDDQKNVAIKILTGIASGADDRTTQKAQRIISETPGLTAQEYALYYMARSIYDETGNGSYTIDELTNAINAVPGLTVAEKRALWYANGKSEKSCPW